MSERADRFTVIIDANVLVGVLQRNLLLTLAEAGFFRPRWSRETIAEVERALQKIYGNKVDAKKQMKRVQIAFPEAVVDVQVHLVESLNLPDSGDHHVLAAAIQAKAAVIVTENIKDFPPGDLDPHEVEAKRLDDFFADCIDLSGVEAVAAIRLMRERFKNPELDAEALLLRLEKLGLTETVRLLTEFKALL